MPEELAGEQLWVEGSAVDRHEGAGSARRLVNLPRDTLLPGACGPGDQHRQALGPGLARQRLGDRQMDGLCVRCRHLAGGWRLDLSVGEERVAHADHRAVHQVLALDALTVEERGVLALQIAQPNAAELADGQLAVLSAGARVVDLHVPLARCSPDDEAAGDLDGWLGIGEELSEEVVPGFGRAHRRPWGGLRLQLISCQIVILLWKDLMLVIEVYYYYYYYYVSVIFVVDNVYYYYYLMLLLLLHLHNLVFLNNSANLLINSIFMKPKTSQKNNSQLFINFYHF